MQNTLTAEQRRRMQQNKWLAFNKKFRTQGQGLKLTAAQLEAIAFHTGNCLVTAGPGSGKTGVIAHRVSLLIAAQAGHILALTFTNKAAREMKRRILSSPLVGPCCAEVLRTSTFHAFAVEMLRRDGDKVGVKPNFGIITEAKRRKLVASLASTEGASPAAVQTALDQSAEGAAGPSPDGQGARWRAALTALECSANCLDFDAVLLQARDLLRSNPTVRDSYREHFKHILIDEFQDTSLLQFEILELLASTDDPERSFFAVGDANQLIYSWRGAACERFEKHFSAAFRVLLNDSFRCSAPICDCISTLMAHRLAEPIRAATKRENAEATVVLRGVGTAEGEANYIAGSVRSLLRSNFDLRASECAVLVRTSSILPEIRKALQEAGLRHETLSGSSPSDAGALGQLLALLHLTTGNEAEEHCMAALRQQKGIGATSLQKLGARADEIGKSLLQVAREALGDQEAATAVGLRKAAVSCLEAFLGHVDALRRERCSSVPRILEALAGRFAAESPQHRDACRQLAYAEDELARGTGISGPEPAVVVAGGALARFLGEVALAPDLLALGPPGRQDETDAVCLATIHSAKGLEWKRVFVAGLEEGMLPHARSLEAGGEEAIEEERRLLFVAMSRAKEGLCLTHSRKRVIRGKSSVMKPSRFLQDLPEESITIEQPKPRPGAKEASRREGRNRNPKARAPKSRQAATSPTKALQAPAAAAVLAQGEEATPKKAVTVIDLCSPSPTPSTAPSSCGTPVVLCDPTHEELDKEPGTEPTVCKNGTRTQSSLTGWLVPAAPVAKLLLPRSPLPYHPPRQPRQGLPLAPAGPGPAPHCA